MRASSRRARARARGPRGRRAPRRRASRWLRRAPRARRVGRAPCSSSNAPPRNEMLRRRAEQRRDRRRDRRRRRRARAAARAASAPCTSALRTYGGLLTTTSNRSPPSAANHARLDEPHVEREPHAFARATASAAALTSLPVTMRVGPRVLHGQRDRAAARADVEHGRARQAVASREQRQLDEQLGLAAAAPTRPARPSAQARRTRARP